jgi:D-alanyl-D-alanine dipeptidase
MTAAGFAPYALEWWHFSFAVPDERRFDVAVR